MDTILISLFLVVIKEVQSTEQSAYIPPYRDGDFYHGDGDGHWCPDGWLNRYGACFFVSLHDVNYLRATEQCKTNHSLLWSTHHFDEVEDGLNYSNTYWVTDTKSNLLQPGRNKSIASYTLTNADDERGPYYFICYMPVWTKIGNHLHYISSPQDREISWRANSNCTILSGEYEGLLDWTSIFDDRKKKILSALSDNDLYWVRSLNGSFDCFMVTSRPTLYIRPRGVHRKLEYICQQNAESSGCHHGLAMETMRMAREHGQQLCIHISHRNESNFFEAKHFCNASGGHLLQELTWELLNPKDIAKIISEMDENREYWVDADTPLTRPRPFEITVVIDTSSSVSVKFTLCKKHLQNTTCGHVNPYICQKPLAGTLPPATNEPTSSICQRCAQTRETPSSRSAPSDTTLSSDVTSTTGRSSTSAFTTVSSTETITDSPATIGFLSSQKSTYKNYSIGGIVGGGVIACVIIVVIIVVSVFLVRRRKSTHKENGTFNNATYNEDCTAIHGTPLPDGITDPNTAPPAYAAISPASPRGQQELPNDHDYEEPPPVPHKQPDIVIYDNNNVNYSEIKRVSSNDNSGLKISENGLYGGSTSGLDVNETVMKDNQVYAGSVRYNANSAVVSNRGYDGYETVMLDNEVYSGSNSDTSKPGLAEGGDVVMKENDLYGGARNDDLKSTDPEDGLVVTENNLYVSNGNVEENTAIEVDGAAKNNEPFYFEVDPKFVKP